MLELIGLVTVVYLIFKVLGSAIGLIAKILLGIILFVIALPFFVFILNWFLTVILTFWVVLLSAL